jgi:ABC-type multidrug transport system permease subunit
MKAWTRALAAAFKTAAPAQTVTGVIMLVVVLYTGYTIPQPSMIGALKWITYINVSFYCHSVRYILLNSASRNVVSL